MKSILKYLKRTFLLLPLLGFLGCGGAGSDNGTLSVGLTDAPTEDYSAVYVTIDSVMVHLNPEAEEADGGWLEVATPQRTYNLLDLTDGVVEGLGAGPLAAGSYTQIRLIIGSTPDDQPNLLCHPHPFANYVIDADDQEIHELKVPSGPQTGLKIVCAGQCEVVPNQTTELILDFDAAASVVVAGNSGNYNLKPTIKLVSTDSFTLISGTVTNSADASPIAGVVVSAQVFDAAASDLKDAVLVRTSAITDANGSYQLFVKPGSYNLVATADGFSPAAVNFTAIAGEAPVQDLALSSSDFGNAVGLVTVGGAELDMFVHTSFRQEVTLDAIAEAIQVESQDVVNGGSYSTPLSVGDYDAVSTTCGLATQSADLNITAGNDTTLDITF